jgi:hypothetical protein
LFAATDTKERKEVAMKDETEKQHDDESADAQSTTTDSEAATAATIFKVRAASAGSPIHCG